MRQTTHINQRDQEQNSHSADVDMPGGRVSNSLAGNMEEAARPVFLGQPAKFYRGRQSEIADN